MGVYGQLCSEKVAVKKNSVKIAFRLIAWFFDIKTVFRYHKQNTKTNTSSYPVWTGEPR